MDTRLYFVLGDLFASILVGTVAGGLCWLLIGPGWNMLIAMAVAMVLGMVIATILWFPLSIGFGVMELMVPCMLSGMLSGMIVGMWCAMEPVAVKTACATGGICGLLGVVTVWVVNNSVRGRQLADNLD